MALIPCPECDRDVSNHAVACPGCGFPVYAALQETLDEVTGSDRSRTFRGKAAAHKLKTWADRYAHDVAEPAVPRRALAENTARIAIWVVVLVIVALQLVWVVSAIER